MPRRLLGTRFKKGKISKLILTSKILKIIWIVKKGEFINLSYEFLNLSLAESGITSDPFELLPDLNKFYINQNSFGIY